MLFRSFLAVLAFALLYSFATAYVKAENELTAQKSHQVEKRAGYTFHCVPEWLQCTAVQVVIRILVFIVTDTGAPLETDLVISTEIESESNPGVVLWSGELTLHAGSFFESSQTIYLPGNANTLFGIIYTDPFSLILNHELLGRCGQGSGDPHMVTFDGHKFDFNGHCSYVLTQECDKDAPSFQVTADFRGRNPSTPYEPPTRMVAFNITNYGTQVIRINEDNSVLIKGKAFTTHSARIGDNEGFVSRSGSNVTIYLTQPSVSLNWNRRLHGITIGLENVDLFSNVCGMLGNADGDPNNDFVMPDGKSTSDVVEFGNSWAVGGSCP
ncbi:mucin-5B-like [Saccoglossus kowalevskii]|uniref:IgGFc-binding protein-like n=1 Tax=Saccoglossus kowalevskii TaxID=10224 RepID=A0ABM0M678_SACKO|nr:PREDICTED: IgGFc-binding protein-like [Saccoglossus kowalevskii]